MSSICCFGKLKQLAAHLPGSAKLSVRAKLRGNNFFCRLSGFALTRMQAQLAHIKSLHDAKNQLRFCFETVLKVQLALLHCSANRLHGVLYCKLKAQQPAFAHLQLVVAEQVTLCLWQDHIA